MSKIDVQKEIGELIFRFKKLKKALQEEDGLTPAQRAATEIANSLRNSTLNKEQLLHKTKEAVEQQHAQRLANQLQKAGILGTKRPPPQPSNEDQRIWLQNNGFQTEEELVKQEANWGNSINNWLTEATKPINARFKNKEEEQAYWDKVRVSDSGKGNDGY